MSYTELKDLENALTNAYPLTLRTVERTDRPDTFLRATYLIDVKRGCRVVDRVRVSLKHVRTPYGTTTVWSVQGDSTYTGSYTGSASRDRLAFDHLKKAINKVSRFVRDADHSYTDASMRRGERGEA